MPVAILVLGVAGALKLWRIPQYLTAFDVDAFAGNGSVDLSTHQDRAMRFADASAALAAWKTSSRRTPLRPDGKPNRPLTAYTIEIKQVTDDE
jgi:hypothetical protein